MRKLKHFAVFLCLFACLSAYAGQVTGLIQSAGGQNLSNATLTWTPTQFAVVAGSFVQTAQSVNCYTDAFGNVVGMPNPLVTATVSAAGGGFLSSGTFYIQYTITGTSGESAPSPELAFFLPGGSTSISFTAPQLQPVGATGYKVYASATPGGEKLQVTVSGFGNTSFGVLAVGASVPSSNTTTCNFNFSDSLIPQARYVLAVTDSNGSSVPGWPQTYYTQGSTFNLNTAVPTNNTTAIFSNAIVSTPSGGATQSILGGLNLNGFNLSGVGSVTANEYSSLFFICPLLDPLGLTDSSALFQNCYNLAYPKGEEVIIPNGKFLLNTAQNWTNKPGPKIGGVASQFQLSSQSPIAGAGESILLCNTGAVCLDATGSGDIHLRDFSVYLAGTGITTPSTVGLLQGRDNAGGGGTANPFCFASKFEIDNVNFVDFTNNTTANGSRGYIGIYNLGAENGIYRNMGLYSGTPIVLASTNVASVSSPFQTLATGCPASMSEVHFDNVTTNSLSSVSSTTPNIEASGTLHIWLTDHEFIGGNAAIKFEGTNQNWEVTGAQESTIATSYFIRSTGNLSDSRFHVEASPSTAMLNPEANNLTFSNNSFDFNTDSFANVPFITNTATGTSVNGGRAVIAGTTSAANTTVTATDILAPGVTDANITFNSGSSYPYKGVSGLIFHGSVKFASGNCTTPGIAFSGSTTTGLIFNSNSAIQWCYGSTPNYVINGNGISFGSGQFVSWSSAADPNNAVSDTGLSRVAAAEVACGNGTASNKSCQFDATILQIQATAFTSLGTPANGTLKYCNDCTVANPCAGAGTGALAKRLNGAWVCN